ATRAPTSRTCPPPRCARRAGTCRSARTASRSASRRSSSRAGPSRSGRRSAATPCRRRACGCRSPSPPSRSPPPRSCRRRPRRPLPIGPYRTPLGKPEVKLLRRSKPCWEELGRHGVPSSVLRVPITCPAEPFAAGTLLSAMCVPDLDGTQGTFTHFTSAPAGSASSGGGSVDATGEGGRRVEIKVEGDRVDTWIEGPPSPLRRDGRPARVRLRLTIDRKARTAVARVGEKKVKLELGTYSEWISLAFPIGLGVKMRGICRLRLLEVEPHVRLYMTPVNIDPDSPVLPISHPRFFATFLSKLIGRYATLGLAE